MTEPPKRILVVRLSSLGDILHTLPAVAALRAALPAANIDWLVDRKWAPVLEGSSAVNRLITIDRGSLPDMIACVRRVRAEKYDCAIDFQGLYKSAVITLFSGIGRRIGFDRAWAREGGSTIFYTDHVIPEGRHVSEHNYSLVERVGAVRPPVPAYPLRVPAGGAASIRARLAESGITDYFVVAPAGSWRAKCWPAERFGEVCRVLEQRYGWRAVIIYGPGEKEFAEISCREAAPAKPLMLSTSLEELMALLARAQCVLAADTGPLHLAAALGAPVVGLYGPTDPARNGPFVPDAITVCHTQPEEMSYKQHDICSPAMLRITTEEVVAAMESRLSCGTDFSL